MTASEPGTKRATGTLRLNRAHYPVTALGHGRRLGIWVQGCPLACAGCMSRDTWDPAGGTEVEIADLLGAWRDALSDGADGLTVSGGEPLAQPEAVAALLSGADAVRRELGREADLLLYTGHEPDELDDAGRAALEHADVVITGRYEAGRPTRRIWRGSANQRMVARTALGRARYAPYEDHEPRRPEMQVAVDGGAVWLIGVPPTGTLGRLERSLRDRGLAVRSTTWRPG